jgi:DNA-binding response OmpR family regulator
MSYCPGGLADRHRREQSASIDKRSSSGDPSPQAGRAPGTSVGARSRKGMRYDGRRLQTATPSTLRATGPAHACEFMYAATAPHILVIDDDPDVRELVIEYLGKNEMRVSAASSGREMFELFDRESVDLVLLDLKLPGEDGMQLARLLRERATVPIVLLTGRNEEADRVMGLELGADDYVTKPFSPRELLARVRAVLRRYQVQATLPERDHARRAFRFSGWELNLRTRRLVSAAGESVELSNGEFSLLNALCRAPQRVLTRDQLLSMSRLHEAEVYDRTIDVQIRRLRLKIEVEPANPALIVTERGAGYRFASEVETLY